MRIVRRMWSESWNICKNSMTEAMFSWLLTGIEYTKASQFSQMTIEGLKISPETLYLSWKCVHCSFFYKQSTHKNTNYIYNLKNPFIFFFFFSICEGQSDVTLGETNLVSQPVGTIWCQIRLDTVWCHSCLVMPTPSQFNLSPIHLFRSSQP